VNVSRIVSFSIFLAAAAAGAQTSVPPAPFPAYLSDGFDFAAFTRFDAETPPKPVTYQSNGFMALQEMGFGGQKIIVPIAGNAVPTNSSDRLIAVAIDAPVFVDAAQKTYRFNDSPAKRSMTYFADRTVYRAAFENGPEVALTVYPVYGKSTAVVRIQIVQAQGSLRVRMRSKEDGFQRLQSRDPQVISYGSSSWTYRLLLASRPEATVQDGDFQWDLGAGSEAALTIALGGTDTDAAASLKELSASPDLFDVETHRAWNEYLAAVPLVAPAHPVTFTVGTTGQQESITAEDLVRSELWHWRGLLNTTCQAHYLRATPIVIADWNVFFGMWSNDGIAEAQAIAGTSRTDLARSSILKWFRYSVNAEGDGTLAWTIFPSGKNTFAANGPERKTQGVPVQASLVGEYIRLTGDASILNEKVGGKAGDRTLWQALLAYQHSLAQVRDPNHDHLIDWLNTYETGWDDKHSPFIDLNKDPTSSINEQVDNLWSLQEMMYLSRLQGEDPAPWKQEFDAALAAVRSKLWDPVTQRYWDLDTKTGKLWTQGENLDAYYFLYFERDPARIAALMKRLDDPLKFNGALLPTLAFDTPNWGGYWRGPAWPREYGYVAMGLARSGHALEGFTWLARGINANLGPLLPENVEPNVYPPAEHAIGSVRIMGHDTIDALLLPDVAGLRTWGGEDLTVAPDATLGKIYIRDQHWMGDRYDAVFEPGHPSRIWRNGAELPALDPNRVWRASKKGQSVVFAPVQDAASR
jgi:hypothetical protein